MLGVVSSGAACGPVDPAMGGELLRAGGMRPILYHKFQYSTIFFKLLETNSSCGNRGREEDNSVFMLRSPCKALDRHLCLAGVGSKVGS